MVVTQLDLRPTAFDILIPRGDDLAVPFAITQGGVAVNISAWQLAAQIRRTADAATVLATMTVAVTNGPGGLGTISLGAVVLNDLEGICHWDLQKSNYPLRTLVAGKFQVDPDVTR